MTSISKSKVAVKTIPIAHSNKISYEERVSSFLERTRPKSAICSPELMAKAGFFYTGQGDEVCCFYCGVSLNEWSANDDPFMEHALASRNCPYICTYKWRSNAAWNDKVEIQSKTLSVNNMYFINV